MAAGYGIQYIETSAKTNLNIEAMFDKILTLTYEFKFKNKEPEPEAKQSVKITAAQ